MKVLTTSTRGLWWEIILLTLGTAFLFYASIVWNPLLAVAVVAPIIIIGYIFEASRMWWLIIGLTPISLNTEIFVQGQVGLYLPTEPMLAGFLILSIPYFLKRPIESRFLNHPISWLIILHLTWMFITVFTSTHFSVSLKSFIVQSWFIIPVVYLGSVLLKSENHRKRFMNLYTVGFSIVLVYTLFQLWSHGFPERESQWLMQPFFKDHTLLGAVLGLIIPYIYLRCFEKPLSVHIRLIWIVLGMISTVVLIFTYSRAAILSLVVAGGLYVVLRLGIAFKYLLLIGILASGIALWNQDALIDRLSSNQAESSGEIRENIESISNISTDASNLERINRWNSALAMWEQKPVFGWGPGTYQFEYAPFQKSADLTIISTNVGDVGNAHSEFLGALSESGAPAMLILIALVLTTIGIGYSTALKKAGQGRVVLIAAVLGYTAYFTHGILNNFLNSDKVAILIWGFTAIIIYYDLDERKTKKSTAYVS